MVFFLQGRDVPAARARGFAIARALAGAGVGSSLRAAVPSVYGDTRLPRPLRNWRPLFYPAALISRLTQLRDLRESDIVFFQRPMFEWPWIGLERWAARGRKSIFDFDDAIYLNRGGRAKLARLVGCVDRVIAGNRTLAEAAAAPEKTAVIPTAIDTVRFAGQATRSTVGPQVVVGWTGTAGNYPQLATAQRGIAAALRRTGARFLVICDKPPPALLSDLRPDYLPWVATREVPDLTRIDIGVMPLPDSPYARGKCAFKLLQYMAIGRPAVASPVGTNTEVITPGSDGFLADSAEQWEEHLVRLIDDPELRRRVGRAARLRVEADYSIAALLPRYLALLAQLHG